MSLWSGKVAVTGVALTILAALLRADPPVMAFCVGVTSALLIYSSARYALRFTHLWRAAARPAARPAGTAAGTAAEASAWLEPEAEAAR